MNNPEPKFDGTKWRCPKCATTLATVAQVEELRPPDMEKKRVTVLELPAGYVKPHGRNEWIKIKKTHPFLRGAENQKKRIDARKFAERQLEAAQSQGDVASICEAKRKLAQFKSLASQESTTRGDLPITRLHTEGLPASIRCAKPGCECVSQIPSIRARPDMAQKDGVC